jgi:N-acetylglucosamine-6-phosphate deacetylase
LTDPVVLKGTVVTPPELIPEGMVVVESGVITYVGPAISVEGEVRDFRDLLVAPGLIDIHVHGGGGHDAMAASREALDGVSVFLAAQGVTSFLATTYTAPTDETLRVAKAVGRATRTGTSGARLLGLHAEGPFINPERAGAQSARDIRPPSLEEASELYDASDETLRMMTLAPELEGATPVVEWLDDKGVVPSAGHSDATYDEMMMGVKAGVRHASHLFNGMRPFHHREPGVAGAALADERVKVELIADGVHLHPVTLGLAVGLKGPRRTALVSDAIAAAGLRDGEYSLGGQRVEVRDGVCTLESGALAGSTLTLNKAVRNMVELVGTPISEAVMMASSTPAAIMGEARKGRLEPGLDADVVVFDWDFRVLLTMVGGSVVYEVA